MVIIRRIYTAYAFLMFCISFLLFFPLFVVCIWIPGWEKYGRKVNQFWANLFFILIFLPVKIEGKEHIKKGQSYIFVSNHFSYLDIAMMGFIPGDVIYIGKSSIAKVPLFGYYFKNLHIAVKRESIKSRGEVLLRSKKAIDNRSSIIIFPEGGICTDNPPVMARFKDGAFSLAIDKQIPIIPVTLSFNHLILPDEDRLMMNFIKAKIVIHAPIETIGKNTKDVTNLKERCFTIIQNQLWEDNKKTAEKLNIKTL
ncbi:lysophospholipid acyltransferase family protein [Aquiflexum sp.]|uniref:lysophospholipid acyltransferase family protein n=1 Tax=Aquiflexum sp. TaxID=1872584 RepID=UPI0035936AB2